MRPSNFSELVKIAKETPDLPGALAKLGVDLHRIGQTGRGATRWQIETKSGRAGDMSAVVFYQNPNGSWVAIDNKERAGRKEFGAIGVLTDLYNCSFEDSVYLLTGGYPSQPPKVATVPTAPPELQEQPKTPFVAPEKIQGKASRVAAYLNKTRCIPSTVVSDLLRIGAIYESSRLSKNGKQMPLMVFPIRDLEQNVVGADTVVTYTDVRLKQILPGSDADFAWRFCNNVEQITAQTKLFFCESAIDAISLCSLTNAPGVYISMAGLKERSFESMRDKLRGTPVLCTDNDEAGNRFRAKYPQYESQIPETGKDWNDELKYRVAHGQDYALKPQPKTPKAVL